MITKTVSNYTHYADRNNLNNIPSFKGAEAIFVSGLRLLNNSPAIGACAVDLGSMVIPRTAVDTKKRGADAGVETGIREGSSTTNHALVGAEGFLAATLVSKGLNHKYKVEANKIFANNDAIDVFKSIWVSSGHDQKEYYKRCLEALSGQNGVDVESKIAGNEISAITEEMANKEKFTKADIESIAARAIKSSGADGSFTLKEVGDVTKPKVITDSIKTIVENMHSLGKSFDKVAKKELGDSKNLSAALDKINEYTKELKNVKVKTALLGLAIPCIIGCSVQPINTYITKKRTGKEGFVGVEGKEPDKSTGFKLMKLAAASAMGLLAFKTIGGGFKGVLNKIQFSSMLPNINQFKLIYGMTIMSRFLSARDKNELRESSIKDFLGFINWLILGGMVSKLVARGLGKNAELINNPVCQEGKKGLKYFWNWVTKSSVKTYDQVLLKHLSEAGKEIVGKDGKVLAFRKLMKMADKATKVKIGKLAVAQVAGYLYSGIVLGFGIAKLNIFITGKVEKNKKTKNKNTPNTEDAKIKFFAQNKNNKNIVFSKINNNQVCNK